MTTRLNMQSNDNTGGNVKQYYSDEGEEGKNNEFKAVSIFFRLLKRSIFNSFK